MSPSSLLLLAALWGAVLLPRALRDVRSSPVSTVTGFSDAMARLAVCDQRLLVVPAGSGQRVVALPRRPATAHMIRRRRTTLVRLLVTAAVAVPVAVVLRTPVAYAAAVIAVVSLLAYCVAMRVIAVRRTRVATALGRRDLRTTRAAPARRSALPAQRGSALEAPLRRASSAVPPPRSTPATPATAPAPVAVPSRARRRAAAAAQAAPAATAGWLDDAFDWAGTSAHQHAPALVADGS